jgi:hypothetical protein
MHSTLSTVGENREKVTSRAGPRVAVTETVVIPPKKKKNTGASLMVRTSPVTRGLCSLFLLGYQGCRWLFLSVT